MNIDAPMGSNLWLVFMWAQLAQLANAELREASADLAPMVDERDGMEAKAHQALQRFMRQLRSNSL